MDLEHRTLGGKWSDITCGFLVRGRRQSVNTSTETRKAWDDDGKVASTDPLGRGVVGEFLPRRVPDQRCTELRGDLAQQSDAGRAVAGLRVGDRPPARLHAVDEVLFFVLVRQANIVLAQRSTAGIGGG